MKVILGGYEVEIKAKTTYNKRYNKDDTLSVLNLLNIWQISEAAMLAHRYEETGKECYKACSDLTYERVSDLHNFLSSFGIYDKYKK